MGQALNLISDWAADVPENNAVLGQKKGLVLRWLNEAQLRFCDKTECLQGTWQPTLGDDGKTQLPDDFLREVPNRVYWSSTVILIKETHANLINETLTTPEFYCIWDGDFYVFAAASGNPKIDYIKKPTEITVAELSTADLDIPTEYHSTLLAFMDAMNSRRHNTGDYYKLIEIFDQKCREIRQTFQARRQPVPRMIGGML